MHEWHSIIHIDKVVESIRICSVFRKKFGVFRSWNRSQQIKILVVGVGFRNKKSRLRWSLSAIGPPYYIGEASEKKNFRFFYLKQKLGSNHCQIQKINSFGQAYEKCEQKLLSRTILCQKIYLIEVYVW